MVTKVSARSGWTHGVRASPADEHASDQWTSVHHGFSLLPPALASFSVRMGFLTGTTLRSRLPRKAGHPREGLIELPGKLSTEQAQYRQQPIDHDLRNKGAIPGELPRGGALKQA